MDRLAKLVHRSGGQLNQAIARFAIFQCLDVVALKSKSVQIRHLWWAAEHADRQVIRHLAESLEILGILQITLGSRLDMDRAE